MKKNCVKKVIWKWRRIEKKTSWKIKLKANTYTDLIWNARKHLLKKKIFLAKVFNLNRRVAFVKVKETFKLEEIWNGIIIDGLSFASG